MKNKLFKNNLGIALASITGYLSLPIKTIYAQPKTILPTGDPSGWKIQQVNDMLTNVTGIALSIAGTVAAIFIIIGGFSYLTAYGDETKAETGKKTLTWAIIGLVVIMLAKVFTATIWNFLTNTATTPF